MRNIFHQPRECQLLIALLYGVIYRHLVFKVSVRFQGKVFQKVYICIYINIYIYISNIRACPKRQNSVFFKMDELAVNSRRSDWGRSREVLRGKFVR